LDAELLGEVYLAMTGGRQFSLGMDNHVQPASAYVRLPSSLVGQQEQRETAQLMRRPSLTVRQEDVLRHQHMMQRIEQESDGAMIWKEK